MPPSRRKSKIAGWGVYANLSGALEFHGKLGEMRAQAPLTGPFQVESFTPSPSAKPQSHSEE